MVFRKYAKMLQPQNITHGHIFLVQEFRNGIRKAHLISYDSGIHTVLSFGCVIFVNLRLIRKTVSFQFNRTGHSTGRLIELT